MRYQPVRSVAGRFFVARDELARFSPGPTVRSGADGHRFCSYHSFVGCCFVEILECCAENEVGTVMASLQIPCPKCGKTLKLPDRSLLGRKGKCPKCSHAFVLSEAAASSGGQPADEKSLDIDDLYDDLEQIERRRSGGDDEIQMEIAEPTLHRPQSGTGARWVPDAEPSVAPPHAGMMPPQGMPPGYPYPGQMPPQMPMYPQQWGVPPGYPQMPYPPQPGMPYPPQQYPQQAGVPYPGAAGYVPMPYGAPPYPQAPMMGAPVPGMMIPAIPEPVAAPNHDDPFAAFAAEPVPSTLPSEAEMLNASPAPTRSLKKRKARQTQQKLALIAGVLIVVLGGVGFALRSSTPAKGKGNSSASKETAKGKEPGDSAPKWESPLPVSPTKGDPIELICMPFGISTVVHLRPAELWESGTKREEFRYCWGPLGEWLEKNIKELCKYEPAQIEEVTFGLLPDVVGNPMHVCGLVRLKQAVQKTDLIKSFKGEYIEAGAGEYPIYESNDYAYVIKDLRTFAFCPRNKQNEMAESVNRANAQSPGLESLLKKSDRLRHITVMFDPTTLGAHLSFVLPAELHRVGERAIEFFSPKQIETVIVSLHVGNEKFHSEIIARNKTSVAESVLQGDLKKRLDKLPRELADSIRGYMNPKQVGPREIIGRFPAMTKVYSLASYAATGKRFASLTTSLPERAAPNLAIGALLTWDESTRTDFNKTAAPPPTKDAGSKLPDLVVDRLKQTKLEVEFAREPLQNAFSYIASECKVEIDIDGDALKSAGFTKNMPQTFAMGKVSGLEAVAGVLSKYAKEKIPMVLVIQEDKKKALITTKEFAEKQSLTPFELPAVTLK